MHVVLQSQTSCFGLLATQGWPGRMTHHTAIKYVLHLYTFEL